jgi:uncharacterized protein
MNSTIENHPSFFKKIITILFALAGIVFILWLDSWFMNHADMPSFSGDKNYGLLVLIGFLTSFHCVGMCGPLILGYATKNATQGHSSHIAHLLYGVGKTISYTLIGGLFGLFGAVVAFTPYTQGMVGIAAGLFLFLFGLHMLQVFPALNQFHIKTPMFIIRFVGKEYRKHSNPFVIGLLNGLMIICGPLQAMYVMAAGTGSWSQGAAVLFFFGLGTLPLLMGFGFLTGLLSANLTPKLLKFSGVIVMALGVIMLNRGLSVTGTGFDFNSLVARISQELSPSVAETPACDNEQTIHMAVLKNKFQPNKFTLRKGIPVKWVIDVKDLNECTKEIVVRPYNMDIKLEKGSQTIEFTPPETGVIPWSCWMGMIPGTFIVVESSPATDVAKTEPQAEKPAQATEQTDQEKLVKEIERLWNEWLAFYQRLFS